MKVTLSIKNIPVFGPNNRVGGGEIGRKRQCGEIERDRVRKGEKDREGDHRDRETIRERDGERGGDRGERNIEKN